MSGTKNHYKVLGVMFNAEQIVITAAYRALASMYHPDKWSGDKADATRRMSEINVAYGVIGDPTKRAAYDKENKPTSGFMDDDAEQVDEAFDSAMSELEDRWNIAVSVVPDLADIRTRLAKIAHRLAFAFVVTILESKKFQHMHALASELEVKFMEAHFGADPKIIRFAKELIRLGRKDAIKALNKYVDVLGSGVPAGQLIVKISKDFALNTYRHLQVNGEELTRLKKSFRDFRGIQTATDLIEASNLTFKTIGYINPEYFVYCEGKIVLNQVFANQVIAWVDENLS